LLLGPFSSRPEVRSSCKGEPIVSPPRLLIFANGRLPNADAARALLQEGDYVVCADAGAHHARLLGVRPNLVVGDLDSVAEDDRAWLARSGVPVVQYPRDKDNTDLELALEHGLKKAPRSIVIIGALGARLDHTLGNIALLADERLRDRSVVLDDGVVQVFLCRGRSEILGARGDLISLIPWGAPANGVGTVGLKWPLRGETLLPEKSRGISNEMTGEWAEVICRSGLLLVVHSRLLTLAHEV
jgi:thiamine pyrophosphokinase